MIDVEAEVNKHKSCTDRDKLERLIQEYKSLALQYAKDFTTAGKYNMVAQRLRTICDRLPAPHLKNARTTGTSVKTATITSEDEAKIKAAWKQRAGSTRDGDKR